MQLPLTSSCRRWQVLRASSGSAATQRELHTTSKNLQALFEFERSLIGMLRPLCRKDRFDLKWHHSKTRNNAVQVALFGLIALELCSCQSGKVIVVTTPLGVSHIMNLRRIAEELAQQRGHQITVSCSFPDSAITYCICGQAS